MSLNASDLELDIIASFKDEFADKWPDLRKYGEEEVRKFAESFVRMLRVHDLSGSVARHLSGRHSAPKGVPNETNGSATGEPKDEIRRNV